MGRRQGEEKRTYGTAPSNKHGQTTLFARESEARSGRATNNAEAEAGFNIKTGELPLFYATSPKLTRSRPIDRNCKVATSPHRLAKSKSEGHGRRREVSADVHLGEGDAERTPVGSHSQEIATWVSSFPFELDTHNTGRSLATLERDSQTSRRGLTDSRNWTEMPGGSFEFRNRIEELSGNLKHGSHLKLPRQLEEHIHNFKLPAIAHSANDNESENQAGRVDATLQSSDCCDVVSFEARRNVAVDVPNSPERDDILRRLNELKAAHQSASPSLLKFVLDDVSSPSLLRFGSPTLDVATYHKEMAKIAARRDHLHQKLKTDPCMPSGCTSPLSKSSTSTSVNKPKNRVSRQSEETTTTLGERRLQSTSSPSGLRGSPRRTAPQPAIQELYPIAPTTSRCKQSPRRSSCSSSIQDQLVSIHKLQFPSARTTSNVSNIPSPNHTPFLSGAKGRIPFKWEEEPGKPKTIANAANAQRLSREESNCVEDILQLGSSQKADENIVSESATVVEVIRNDGTPSARSSPDRATVGISDGGRVESHRYYGRAHLRRYSESSYGHSSRRYGTHESLEAQIDLDASAAAKFLVELYDTPLSTPGRHGSSPLFAVPFKWEDAPGKAKVETPVGRPNILQLPPRLAVPSYRSAVSFSQDLRASHPFAGFFAPCLTASSPGQQQQQRKQSDRMLVQYGSSKSLPPRVPSSPSASERRKRHGLVGRCYSTPQEGCQIRVSKSTASSPVLQAVSRNFVGEETKNPPGSWIQKTSRHPNTPSSPRSILCGPDEGSSSQTSASNVFSSGDLEDFTEQTSHSGQAASKSSNSSFESIEDFTELPIPASSNLHPSLHSGEPQASPKESSSHRPQESNPNAMNNPLFNLSKAEKQKTQKQRQQNTTQSPEPSVWSPALANYFQSLELTEARSTSTSTSATSTSISDRCPTASGYLNSCKGELPLAPKPEFPTIQSMLSQQQPLQENLSSAQASPERPTRLPYTMPSVAEQLLASCDNSARRQLVHNLSPRLLQQYSGRRLTRSSYGHNSGRTAPAPRVERYHADEVCHTFPAYAAALQLLSPAAPTQGTRQTPHCQAPPTRPLNGVHLQDSQAPRRRQTTTLQDHQAIRAQAYVRLCDRTNNLSILSAKLKQPAADVARAGNATL